MNTLLRTIPVAMLVLLGSAAVSMQAQNGPPPGAYQGQGGWDGPPNEFNEAQRRGFHDGIEGARKDFGNHRQPNVRNREEFRHPSVPEPLRHDYRMGFRRGYDVAVSHMMGGGGGPR